MLPAAQFNPSAQPPLIFSCPHCAAPLEVDLATIEQDMQAAGRSGALSHSDLLECPECERQFSYTARPVLVWAVDVEALAPATAPANIPFSPGAGQ